LATPTALQLAITTAWSRFVLAASKSPSESFCSDTCRGSPCRYINLPGSLSAYPIPHHRRPYFILKTDHVAWEWPITLKELPSILNKLLAWWFASNLQLPEGGCLARWSKTPCSRALAPPEEFGAGSCTPNPAPTHPHVRGRDGTPRGSSASQPPVEFRPYSPWVVGAGSGRVPGPKLAAGTAASATCRISGSLGGPEIR
jgi:hypothetical protein